MLTDRWTPLRYHRLQSLLWRSPARFKAVAAGRGSGKTEIARRYIVRWLPVKKPWSRPLYFYALPTYKQARRVAWNQIIDLIPKHWLKGKPNASEMRIDTIYGSQLYVVGLDNPQRIEGDQWDGGIVDESCDIRPGAFGRSILPALTHRNGWCWRIGVPKRFGIGAQEFKDFFFAGDEPGKGAQHESYAWPSEDILTPEQLAWAKENLDPRDFREQFQASWENAAGLLFYAFDPIENVNPGIRYHADQTIMVGSDFNVDPMAWILGQRPDDETFDVYDEIWLRNTNTEYTLNYLHDKHDKHESGWEFFGDASSRARNTRASTSDYYQIKNDERFIDARTFYPKKNPNVANRIAACNAMLCNAAGRRRLKIHPKCKHLIYDLQSRVYKPGSRDAADEGDIGHITDALGYVIHRVFPIRPIFNDSPQVGV